MGLSSFLAVGVGAAIGAWLRWALGIYFNPVLPALPLGTLAANLIGGYLIGLAIAYFSSHTGLPPEVRLFIITGFMGGLTTFSTFSAEAVSLFSRTEWLWAFTHLAVHVGGSLLMTALGMFTFNLLRAKGGM